MQKIFGTHLPHKNTECPNVGLMREARLLKNLKR